MSRLSYSVNDLRYPAYLAAILKAGYIVSSTLYLGKEIDTNGIMPQPLFTSPRNSLDGQVSLLHETKCRKFIFTPEMQACMDQIQIAIPDIFVVESLGFSQVMDESRWLPPYIGHQSREEGSCCYILHTSGSTGLLLSHPLQMPSY